MIGIWVIHCPLDLMIACINTGDVYLSNIEKRQDHEEGNGAGSDCKCEDIALAQKAVETINRESTSKGLTKKIEKLLEK